MPDYEVRSPANGLPLNGWRIYAIGVALGFAGVALLAFSPSIPASMLALAMLVVASAVWPPAGLALLSLTLPFYLQPKNLGSLAFSMPELVLLATFAGCTVRAAWRWIGGTRPSLAKLATPFDGPAALFLLAALLSLLASEVLRVSLRELRLMILEPLIAYYLAAWFLSRG